MVHSSCPKCPDDFKVKNIPDEVECLVANKIKANELKNVNDYRKIASLKTEFDSDYSADPQIIQVQEVLSQNWNLQVSNSA